MDIYYGIKFYLKPSQNAKIGCPCCLAKLNKKLNLICDHCNKQCCENCMTYIKKPIGKTGCVECLKEYLFEEVCSSCGKINWMNNEQKKNEKKICLICEEMNKLKFLTD